MTQWKEVVLSLEEGHYLFKDQEYEEIFSKREEKKQRTELFRERVKHGIDLLNIKCDIDSSHSIEKRKWESLKLLQKRYYSRINANI